MQPDLQLRKEFHITFDGAMQVNSGIEQDILLISLHIAGKCLRKEELA